MVPRQMLTDVVVAKFTPIWGIWDLTVARNRVAIVIRR